MEKETKPVTIALMWNDQDAWLRVRREAVDITLSKAEVMELYRTFKRCVESWAVKK